MKTTREMRRTDWTQITKRDYVSNRCCFQGKEGIASLLTMHEVTETVTVQNANRTVTIVDEGISWLQIALREQYVWMTAMFDPNGKLLQIYFDITNGNCLEPEDNPSFEDLYLDIVMEPDGKLHLLDRDELDVAFHMGKISDVQYQRTVSLGEYLSGWLSEHRADVIAFCFEEMMKLKGLQKRE